MADLDALGKRLDVELASSKKCRTICGPGGWLLLSQEWPKFLVKESTWFALGFYFAHSLSKLVAAWTVCHWSHASPHITSSPDFFLAQVQFSKWHSRVGRFWEFDMGSIFASANMMTISKASSDDTRFVYCSGSQKVSLGSMTSRTILAQNQPYYCRTFSPFNVDSGTRLCEFPNATTQLPYGRACCFYLAFLVLTAVMLNHTEPNRTTVLEFVLEFAKSSDAQLNLVPVATSLPRPMRTGSGLHGGTPWMPKTPRAQRSSDSNRSSLARWT